MQISMKFAGEVGILVYQLQFRVAVHKLFVKAITMSCLIVSVCDVAYGHRFGTMLATNPV